MKTFKNVNTEMALHVRPRRLLARFMTTRLAGAPLPVTDISGMVALAACFTELLHKCRVVTIYAVLQSFLSFWFRVSILPPQPGSPALGENAPDTRRKACQWRAFANWRLVSRLPF
jgi:hypothetical protein